MQTRKLNLLIVLLFVLLPLSTRANGAEKNMMLYTPYTKITVPPGESISYSIDVINNCDEVKNATISVEGMPRGWKYEVKAGGWTLNQLSVLPGEKKTFTMTVEVPMKVNKGTYHFTVAASGLAELPLTVTVSEQGTYQTDFTTKQPNMQGNSKSTFNFNATLKNQTGDQQLYALMATAPRGWNVIFRVGGKQATSAQVEANATENISIDITPPANVKAGSYKIPVHVTTSSTSADLELEVVVTGSYEMELTTPQGLLSSEITAGETKRIDLIVRNDGSAELNDISLSANKPVDWEVSFEPSKIEKLPAGSSVNVNATIKASKKALPGDYVTKMTAKTPEVNQTVEFRVMVRTPMIYGWLGILIIVVVLGGVYYLFRKYGRR
ncbi:hypothetical protein DW103_10445 [Parabacteroides sp. AM08-6]|nr:hypothetical protein DW103_10445 [Parabacteroides sp. AM08-6]